MKKTGTALQGTCLHPEVTVLGSAHFEDSLFSWTMLHVQCVRCLKLFGRDDWSTRVRVAA